MKRYLIMKGDRTTADGVVQEGDETFKNEGRALAYEGAKIYCPACQSEGYIRNVPPFHPMRAMGKQVALENDLCICKCDPPPRLIASQSSMSMTVSDSEAAALGYHPEGASIAAAAGAAGPIASAALSSTEGVPTTGVDDTDSATPLGDAQPFEDAGTETGGDATDLLAARGVSEADEAECFAQYERDMDECNAYRTAMGGQRFMDVCSQRAFQNYQLCRGY